ncbi:DUF3375 domain-containing protein [Dictyobacter kobayashii]|uniref:DUF3375 domain-containing protein n=1 Tax=Dictyobacter kobayashii TaxID=2014872 RepID=A0A402AT14_9CHLR|nr:DUF3375 domain-containing protein [Dictyobacter kobayashii]GCE22225.1 hypothetical protein KDK_60250 [Dictyobacter kobayashii]
MDYERLEVDLQHSPAIKLLRADNAALILRFFHQEFKREPHVSLHWSAFVEHLEDELERIHLTAPGRYPRSAQAYVSDWADQQFIRIIAPVPGRSEKPTVELTADAERAIGWLDEMHAQPFVGTESRFLLVVQMLQDIVHKSTEDPQERLAQLEQQRDELQRQIEDIRATGKVDDRYTSTQVRERFFEATALARQLLRDFHLVEDRFREIAHSIQERQLQPDIRKGSLIEYVLDADSELKLSDQGRSFYAFWDFLMAPSQQDIFYTLLDNLRHIPELQPVARADDILRRLPAYLINAGEQVVQSNSRLAEQLRRILDEQARAESRRVRELTTEIKFLARQIGDSLSNEEGFLELEGPPFVSLIMERGLWEPSETIPVEMQPEAGDDDLTEVDFIRLHTQFYVDEAVLCERIESILALRPEVTLAHLLEQFPLDKGLSELLAYCSIAAKSTSHRIDSTQKDVVPLFSSSDGIESPKVVVLPRVLYRRNSDEK